MADKTKKPSFLDELKAEARKFFSAGTGEAAVLTIEKFVDEKIRIALEGLNAAVIAPKLPAIVRPIEEKVVDVGLDKGTAFLESETQRALEAMRPAPVASSTVSAAPSTPADNAPAHVFKPTAEQSAFMRTLSGDQLVAYIKAHS